ncbi:MAG: FAD-dependent oxidoreductase [Lentisphaerae bacterium]|nr:FAD-dependent oxidoreductase [Lentisphaerota bacterium]
MTTPLAQPVDVLVAGGGPSGFGAAVAAARMGARVALIERHPMLGGMGTAALVNNFCRAHLDGNRLIIGGIFAELRQRLIDRKAIYLTDDIEPYDPDVFAAETRAMCDGAGVHLCLGQGLAGAQFPVAGSAHVTLTDGTVLTARTVVDATGDSFLAARAGAPFHMGRQRDQAVMPLTLCYELGPVDRTALRRDMPELLRQDPLTGEHYVYQSNHPTVNAWLAEARRTGDVSIPRDHVASILSIPGRPDYATVNFGRVFIDDPTNAKQLARAEIEGRHQVAEGLAFFQKYIPGFRHARLTQLARQIGVRESRHIVGLYTLTAEDLLAYRQFEDVVAQCRYSIDIHEPGSDRTTMTSFPPGTHYDIPWRCLVPAEGPPNLIVAGRSISASHEAASSFRVSPSVMAIGEAAGVTAALAARDALDMGAVSPADVQQRLRASGGILA